MWGSKAKLAMPSKEKALPCRAERLPVPAAHFVNRHPLTPPFPAGLEMAMFGLGCFWGSERKFWEAPGAITTEILDAPEFYDAEDYHQQYLAKNPSGYCGLGGTGVACPTGLLESAGSGR